MLLAVYFISHSTYIIKTKIPCSSYPNIQSQVPLIQQLWFIRSILLSIMLQRPHWYHLRSHVRSGSAVGYFRVASHCHESHQAILTLLGRRSLDLSRVNGSLILAICLETYQTVAFPHVGVWNNTLSQELEEQQGSLCHREVRWWCLRNAMTIVDHDGMAMGLGWWWMAYGIQWPRRQAERAWLWLHLLKPEMVERKWQE